MRTARLPSLLLEQRVAKNIKNNNILISILNLIIVFYLIQSRIFLFIYLQSMAGLVSLRDRCPFCVTKLKHLLLSLFAIYAKIIYNPRFVLVWNIHSTKNNLLYNTVGMEQCLGYNDLNIDDANVMVLAKKTNNWIKQNHTSYLSFHLHRHSVRLKYFTPKMRYLWQNWIRVKKE